MRAPRTEFRIVRSGYGEENVLRGLFSAFLDSGAADSVLSVQLPNPRRKTGPRTDSSVGVMVRVHRGREIADLFQKWADASTLASYLLRDADGLVKDLVQEYRAFKWTVHVLDPIVGARHRELIGERAAALPSDPVKSFSVKSANLVGKFLKECGDGKVPTTSQGPDGKIITMTPSLWIRASLTERGLKCHMPSPSLRELQRLYQRLSKVVDLSGPLEEVFRLADVGTIMGS